MAFAFSLFYHYLLQKSIICVKLLDMMKNLLEKNNSIKPAQVGKIVQGKIIGKGRSAVYLDLGPIGTGIIFGKEFQQVRREVKNLKIGDSLTAKIIGLEIDQYDYIDLSLNQASDELTWEKLKEKKEKNETLVIKISGANKGGLLTEVFGIPAFLPVSQLLSENYPIIEKGDTSKIAKELQKFVGQEMEVKIFSLDIKEKKLILSEKIKDNERIKELLKKYKEGDIVEGEVIGITNFGVFIKFKEENLEGLIHISELDWQLIEDPAQIVKVGEKIKAKIISISDHKISLSLKVLKKNPWQDVEKNYKKGDIIEGKVTKFNPYGVFVQITPKIQGLCHISEFGTKSKMEEVLKIDKKYKFEILAVEPKEHRISLKPVEEKI